MGLEIAGSICFQGHSFPGEVITLLFRLGKQQAVVAVLCPVTYIPQISSREASSSLGSEHPLSFCTKRLARAIVLSMSGN